MKHEKLPIGWRRIREEIEEAKISIGYKFVIRN